MLKSLTMFGILIVFIFAMGIVSSAEAHPHATIELMDSHSHEIGDKGLQENFLIHTFEQVVFSIVDFVNSILSR